MKTDFKTCIKKCALALLLLAISASSAACGVNSFETSSKTSNDVSNPASSEVGEEDERETDSENETTSLPNDEDSSFENNATPKEKISGTISSLTGFSEGYAFAQTNNQKDKLYCINTVGEIEFVLDIELRSVRNFCNGIAVLNGALCNKEGKLVTPESVGVTKFITTALYDGYIFTETEIAGYADTIYKTGVMDNQFNWLVEPTEALYDCSYCGNGVLYLSDGSYFDIKTNGTVESPSIDDLTPPNPLPSEYWLRENLKFYNPFTEELMLDLSSITNIMRVTDFQNGKCLAKYYNEENHKYFFNFINEKGEFLFDPVPVFDSYTMIFNHEIGDDFVVFYDDNSGSKINFKSYDTNGNLLGSINTKDLKYANYSLVSVNEGIIVLRGGYTSSSYYYAFDKNFNLLPFCK